MTCEEFDAALLTDPVEATIGLHAAVVKHAKECLACYAKVNERTGPRPQFDPLTEAYIEAAVLYCNVRCLADSEFRETALGEKIQESGEKSRRTY